MNRKGIGLDLRDHASEAAFAAVRNHQAIFDEISRSMRVLSEASPMGIAMSHSITAELAEQTSRHQAIMDEIVRPHRELSKSVAQALKPMLEAGSAARLAMGGVDSEVKWLNTAALASIGDIVKSARMLADIPDTRVLTTQFSALANLVTTADFGFRASVVTQFSELVAEELASGITTVHQESRTGEDSEVLFAIISRAVIGVLDRIPGLNVSQDAVIQIIATILIAWVTQVSGQSDWREVTSRLDELIALQKQADPPQPPSHTEDDAQFIVAVRPVRLRAAATIESAVLHMIYPNQQMVVKKQESAWLYVSFFDHVDEIPRTGWVYKRYVKSLNP